jgi:hypothetical protein
MYGETVKNELSLVYARFEILTMLLRPRSWEVQPRQLVNTYKEVRRIVVPWKRGKYLTINTV